MVIPMRSNMVITMSADKSFQQRDIAAKHDFRGAAYEPSVTVTAQERLDHIRNRARPAPQQHLRPKGFDHAHVQSQIEKWRERRIAHIDTRLKVADFGLNRDRMKAVNKGRAKAGFNSKAQGHKSSHER